MAWALARKRKECALWSVSPMQATDLVHMLGAKGKKGKALSDQVAAFWE